MPPTKHCLAFIFGMLLEFSNVRDNNVNVKMTKRMHTPLVPWVVVETVRDNILELSSALRFMRSCIIQQVFQKKFNRK